MPPLDVDNASSLYKAELSVFIRVLCLVQSWAEVIEDLGLLQSQLTRVQMQSLHLPTAHDSMILAGLCRIFWIQWIRLITGYIQESNRVSKCAADVVCW